MRIRTIMVMGAVLLALAACSRQPSQSTSTASRPTASATRHVVTPVAGACYDGFWYRYQITYYPKVVDCSQQHYSEVIQVGTYPGVTPGTPRPADVVALQRSCDSKARAALPYDLATRRVVPILDLPTAEDSQAGARWYVCELTELEVAFSSADFPDFSVLDGPLRSAPPAPRFCIGDPDPAAHHVVYPCDQPHRAELIGTFAEPTDAPRSISDTAPCRKLILADIGVDRLAGRWQPVLFAESQVLWDQGIHAVDCYFSLPDGVSMSGSISGTHGRGIPLT